MYLGLLECNNMENERSEKNKNSALQLSFYGLFPLDIFPPIIIIPPLCHLHLTIY